ncbi:hypothetical protein [Actinocrispum sp. NPDC049592]|uniref:hypothetical protein n=1 Tax=Actinocrispum sp. NPDC049592 TaxID=3154835 RepID=UPI0034401C3B
MDELERRLRSALVELAEEVPPSHNAWADQERRLALKSRRARVRPVLMAAVAAAVAALIAVPVVIFNLRPSGVQAGGVLPAEEHPSSVATGPASNWPPPKTGNNYVPVPNEKLITEPVSVETVTRPEGQWETLVYTVQRDGTQLMCSIPLPYGVKVNGADQAKYGSPACLPLIAPRNGRLMWFKGFLPNSANGMYAYVMTPNVQSVLVRTADNAWKVAYRIGPQGPDYAVLIARLGPQQGQPKAYTARDGRDATLENG